MRYARIVLICVCCMLLSIGCNGKYQTPSANPEPASDQSTLQVMDGLAFPVDDGAPPRLTSVDTPDEKLGRVTFQRGNATTDGDSLHVLAGGYRSIAYGIYRFDGLADEDAVIEAAIERTDLQAQGGYWFGIADFDNHRWLWTERGNSQAGTTIDTIALGGVNGISPSGYAYIAILLYDGAEMWVDTVTLTSDLDLEAPVASFTATPSHANSPQTVDFDASASFRRGGGSITHYAWDFDNDGAIDETNVISWTSFNFTEPGEYRVRLLVTSDNGYTDEHFVPVFIHGWIHTWGNSDRQRIEALERRGDFLYALGTDNIYTDEADYLLACFDVWGEPCWQLTYDSGAKDTPCDIICPDADTVVVTGWTTGFDVVGNALLTVAFSTSGELLWQQVWDSSTGGGASKLAVDSSGNIYVVVNASDIELLKYSPAGELLWHYSIDIGEEVSGDPVMCHSMNNLYVAVPYVIRTNFACLKFDTDGNLINQSFYDRGYYLIFEDIAADISGNVYLAGSQYQDDMWTDDKVFLARFDNTLTLQWASNWEIPPTQSFGRSVELYTDLFTVTNVLVTGYLSRAGYTNKTFLLNYTPSGTLQWARSWSSATVDSGFICSTLGTGGAYVFGGYAGSNSLTRVNLAGTANSVTCTAGSFTPTVTASTGVSSSPAGTVVTISGVMDTGGGEEDLLLIGYDITD